MAKRKKKKEIYSKQQPPDIKKINVEKKNRITDSSCHYYLKGTCTFANKDCSCNAIYCKKSIKPKYQLVASVHPTSTIRKRRQNGVLAVPDIPSGCIKVDFSNDIPYINIYGGSLLAAKQYLEDRAMIVSSINRNNKYTIFVTYNRNTDTYYIAKEHLQIYSNRKMRFFAKLGFANSRECTESLSGNYDEFDQMSFLSMYGYRVGKTNGLKARERHEILSFLIDNNICSISYITSVLQFNIRLREKAFETYRYALQQWREDLEYVLRKL